MKAFHSKLTYICCIANQHVSMIASTSKLSVSSILWQHIVLHCYFQSCICNICLANKAHGDLLYWSTEICMKLSACMDILNDSLHGPLTNYQNYWLRMRQEYRERFPRHWLQRKPLVSDPDMHHGTCAKHVLWCMSGSLTHGGGENVPGIPGACASRSFAYLERGPCHTADAGVCFNIMSIS